MDFEYCEKCGKRFSKDDIKPGTGTYDGVHYFCPDCSPKDSVEKPSRSDRTNGRNNRTSSAPTPAPVPAAPLRSASRRSTRDDDEYLNERPRGRDRESRTSSRGDERNSRSNNRSRESYRDSEPDRQGMNKNLLIGGGVLAGLLIIGIVVWAVSGTTKKLVPTPTPISSIAPSAPAYADAVEQADKIFSEAKKLYSQGKNSSSQAKGIKKAIDHLETGLVLLYKVLDEYDKLKLPHPKPVEKLLTTMQSLNEGWRKSMPIDVW